MSSGRHRRTRYDFCLGYAIETLGHQDLLRLAASQIQLADLALRGAERNQALGRLAAALEAINEARRRGDQLELFPGDSRLSFGQEEEF